MSQHQDVYPGKWYGRQYYYGFHNDLHVDPDDRDIGAYSNADALAAMFRLVGADFVQTDGKGHPGYTSWLSQVPGAFVAPGIVRDPLAVWRAATKKLGIPLHVAYSGIFEKAQGAKHPEWCILDKNGKPITTSGWYGPVGAGDRMCPRSPYVDEIMIPQLVELIDRYEIDGFWIDGDLWAMEACYCDRCTRAFKEKTGLAEPPGDPAESSWPAWWNFTRESYEAYVAHYCEAVHQHKPGVLIASNWYQGFRCPGAPTVPTDWISGDALAIGKTGFEGSDGLRLDGRFLPSRGKPWDIMLWPFYGGFHDTSTMKPVDMLQQQAATIIACGGNFQTCDNPFIGVRSGQLVEWRIRHLKKLVDFVKARQALCSGTETIPQIAVLHSEHHFRSVQTSTNLFFGVDIAAVSGTAHSLIESQYGVDILDEWALLPRLSDFPVVVAPEQNRMSAQMQQALRQYVLDGGKLLVTGGDAWPQFGEDFLGVSQGELAPEGIYDIPVLGESVKVKSTSWRLLGVTTARTLVSLAKNPLISESLLPYPAATVNQVGKGEVAYIPFDVFRDYDRTRYPLLRSFIQGVVRELSSPLDIEVTAPACVDVVLRQKDNRRMIHFINQADCKYYDLPPVGPVAIKMKLSKQPEKVYRAFEEGELKWEYSTGLLTVEIPSAHVHEAVVVVE